jgi:acyl-CoA synthetase (AMP-forming)/AMP-acid ligase II
VRGLMMDYPLTIPTMLRRAETLFAPRRVASRRPDRTIVRLTYGEIAERVRRLAVALTDLGVQPGDRVATLGWNHHEHLEAYFAIPSIGAVLHTLNLRLHPDDLTYIVNDARDRVLLVDESLLPLLDAFRGAVGVEYVIVMAGHAPEGSGLLDYSTLLADADPARHAPVPLDECQAAAMCYTSGTTGRPKGVLYSHRSVVLHAIGHGLADTLAISERDRVMPAVPMFHVNAWGFPFSATFFGAGQVFPGPFFDPTSLLDLIETEHVSVTAGVPTVWLGVLQELDAHPGVRDLASLRVIAVGGSAAPESMIRAFEERHGLRILHAWGMTEMSPLGTVCTLPSTMREAPHDAQMAYRAKQGTPIPLVEVRARTATGLAPWDGQTMGELEVRGAWVASQYYNQADMGDRFTEDGWFKTGDIVTIASNGCVEITDRVKDLVKSGGEWISSVALESALMGHPAVAEAAVVAVPHPKWDERPLAVVVLKKGRHASAAELVDYLRPSFAKWWLPDAVEFVEAIPRTSAGKFRKSALRDRFRERYLELGAIRAAEDL